MEKKTKSKSSEIEELKAELEAERAARTSVSKDYEQKISKLFADCAEMGNHIRRLKNSINSYKSANSRLSNERAQLMLKLNEAKALEREADELNEAKAGIIDQLKSEIEAKLIEIQEKDSIIDNLRKEKDGISSQLASERKYSEELECEIESLHASHDRPLWKRIFGIH